MALSDYLALGSPRKIDSETGSINVWRYVGPTSVLEADKPGVNSIWTDSLPVSVVDIHPFEENEDWSELIVTTAQTGSGEVLSTVLEKVQYELTHAASERPLEIHPYFRTGGTYALDANARGHIQGWKMEIDPTLKKIYHYKIRDSDGTAGAEKTVTGNALEFIYRLELGIEAYVEYHPVWTKVSTYRGADAPSTSEVGLKVTSPSGSGYPSGYEWIKTADDVQGVGGSNRWKRHEQWTGAKKVFVDKNEIFAI